MRVSSRRLLIAINATVVATGLALSPAAAQQPSPQATSDPGVGGLTVVEPWTRASMMRDLANAVYFTIENHGDIDDAIVRASSPSAEIVEMHETSADDQGLMTMSQVLDVPVPAHGQAVLEPGGLHIMLMGLEAMLEEGAMIELTLEFASAEPQTIEVPVRAMGPMAEMGMDDASAGDEPNQGVEPEQGMVTDDMNDDSGEEPDDA